MATKKAKDPLVERHKLITKIVKAVVSRNAVLLSEGFITVTDLETEVSIPYPEMGDIDTCIPANRFLDCIAMMDRPKIKVVHNKEPMPVRDHFRHNGKIWNETEEYQKTRYQFYLNRTERQEDQQTFDEWLESDVTQLTEEQVEQKYNESDQVEISHGKRVIKLCSESTDNYPVTGIREGYFNHYADLGENELRLIETCLKFVSNDDLRPAMTGIYFDEKDIVATDAHRLFWHTFPHIPHKFILPANAAKLLLKIGGTWSLYGNGGYEMKDGKILMKQPTKKIERQVECFMLPGMEADDLAFSGTLEAATEEFNNRADWEVEEYPTLESYCKQYCKKVYPDDTETVEVPDLEKEPTIVEKEQTHVIFVNQDGIMLTARVIDARYPDFRVVIPEGEGNYVLTVNPDELLSELKNAMKFANKSTHQVTFCLNGKATISAQDIDFESSYQNELELAEIKKLKSEEDLVIGFNGNFISQIVADLPCEPVRIKMWAANKAAIINDNYLVMPLMIIP